MANAVNGMAWWIEHEFGRSKTFETLAYFGAWDPRYIFLLLAAVKVGYKMLFPSLLWDTAGLVPFLDLVGCRTILVSSMQFPVAKSLLQQGLKQLREIPSLSELLDTSYEHYAFDKTFGNAKSDPLVMVHTSGTTGEPKPLTYTNDWAASWILQNQLSPPRGFESLEFAIHGVEACAIAPPNHISNLLPNLFGAIPNQMTVLYPMADATVSLETTVEVIRHNDPDLLIAPAFVLNGIASSPDLLEELSSKVSMIGFGGGPLGKHSGDILAQSFRLFSLYALSETGTISKIVPSAATKTASWDSMKPHPQEKIEFRKVYDNSYEAVIVRDDSHDNQPVFKIFPELTEFHTKDLFTPDPALDGFWTYQGRLDDILILSNGSTVNPTGFEQRITKSPLVKDAVMCGTGRIRPALLMDLSDEGQRKIKGIDGPLWALVKECNRLFPPQASVAKSHVLLTSPEKPLPRSGKGTVRRKAAIDLYQHELGIIHGALQKPAKL